MTDSRMITKDEILDMGFSELEVKKILRQVRAQLVSEGHPYYSNKQLKIVPREAVLKLLGMEG